MAQEQIKKAKVPKGYPPEEGCYLRGNDYSPVAVCVILKWKREETPNTIEQLVRAGLETGAALSGTLQTENVGLEKVICNIVANPNIRYLIVCGPETPGHHVGNAVKALYENGIDKEKKIVGTDAPAPFLFNIPQESIQRFIKQTKFIDLVNEGSPEVIRDAVWSCYQEKPTPFKQYELWDMGAYEAESICKPITWNITNPAYGPRDEKEKKALGKMQELIKKLKERNKK
ncbi:MAG: tetrahydromethanopterin S-methyltransferase subunit A [Candidatus Omnitrophica bacterium]|nr:tetrahydromethanopterin S-methyltransferase subunit A [Candidatus Omnitrophota bacterium]